MDLAEEEMSKLEDKPKEIMQFEDQRKKERKMKTALEK